MSRNSKFGWSYPPGCSGPPEDGRDPSELEDAVLELLEEASIPTAVCDQIMKLIEQAEIALHAARENDGRRDVTENDYLPE